MSNINNFQEAYKFVENDKQCMDISKAKFMYSAGVDAAVRNALMVYRMCCSHNVDNECYYSEVPTECRMDCLPCAYFAKNIRRITDEIKK